MFNAEKAKEAGYSDTEIAEYLAKQTGFNAGAAREAGYSDSEIIKHVASKPKRTWGQAVGEAVENFPKSAGDQLGALYTMASQPVQTFETFMTGAGGGMETLFPQNAGLRGSGNVDTFSAITDMYGDRLGSMEAIKNTLATDPVGLLGDTAGLLAGGGGLLRAGGLAAKAGGAAGMGAKISGIGEAASRAGSIIDPLNIARQAATAPLRVLPDGLPSRLWNSAVKPSSTKFKGREAQAALFNTAFENDIPLNVGGADKLQRLMDGVGTQVDDIIRPAAARGETIDAFNVANRVDDLRPYYENQALPGKYTQALDDVQYGFLNSHPQNIPVDKALQMKRNIYHENRKKYGETRTVGDEAEKAVARGIKEELHTLHPELKALDGKFKEYINLDGAIEDALQRIGKHQLFGLTAGMWTGAGYMAGDLKGMIAAGLGKLIMDSQPVKARLAMSLAAAKRLPEWGTKGAGVRNAGIGAQRAEDYLYEDE